MTAAAAMDRVALANFRDVDAERFSRLVRDSSGYRTVVFEDLVPELAGGRIPPATVCVALDADDLTAARAALLRTRAATDLPVLLLAPEHVVQEALTGDPLFDDALPRDVSMELLRGRLHAMARIAETRSIAIQSQRLADLGSMLASVTHELNNPLSYVRSNVSVAMGDLADLRAAAAKSKSTDMVASLSEIAEMLADTQVGVERVIRIVADLRLVAREGRGKPVPTSISSCAESAIALLRGQMPAGVEVVRRFALARDVLAEPGRVVQVLINLIANARDALGDTRGQIEVRTFAREAMGVVEVADDGPGMSPDVLDRAFHPFFTTKPAGEGTGLGLTISRQLVQTFNGEITLSSEQGRGTVARVVLPLASPGHA